MSQYNASGHKAYKATAALAKGVLVKLASGEAVVSAAATDKSIGVTVVAAGAGEMADIRLLSAQGTSRYTAGGNIAVGDLLVAAAAGKVVALTQAAAGAQPTSVVVGRALETAVNGDLFEAEVVTFLA